MPEVKLATSFLRDLFDLSKEVQKEAFDFIDQISNNHPSGIPGLKYEKMQNTTSGLSIYSARINQKYRALIHEEKNELHLLKIANHQNAYNAVNSVDVVSIMNVDNLVISNKSTKDFGKLFAGISNKELQKVGIKTESDLQTLRTINNEAEYNKLKQEKFFSDLVFENLDFIIAELSINELVTHYRDRYKKAMNLLLDNVIEPALKHPDLPDSIKLRVKNTKDRLTKKESLEEIIFFYNDALESNSGKNIVKEFRKLKLHAFEEYQEEILKIVRG